MLIGVICDNYHRTRRTHVQLSKEILTWWLMSWLFISSTGSALYSSGCLINVSFEAVFSA